MTNKEIKAVMKEWHKNYIDDMTDESYFELYKAFHTLKASNLITDEQWKMIYDYDRKLFQEAN